MKNTYYHIPYHHIHPFFPIDQRELYTLIEKSTTCTICFHIQLIPSFTTVDGGITLHESCAKQWLANRPANNLYGTRIKHATYDINTHANDMYKYALKHTTIYDKEIQALTSDDIKSHTPLSIINLLLEIPKLITLISPSLIITSIIQCLTQNPSFIHKLQHPLLNPIWQHMTENQIKNIPTEIFLEYYNTIFISHPLSTLSSPLTTNHFFTGCINYPSSTLTFLKQNPSFPIPKQNDKGYTPLMIVCVLHYSNNLFTHLLNHTNDTINYIDQHNESVLTLAFTLNKLDYVYALLSTSSEINIHQTNSLGDNVLTWSIFNSYTHITQLVIQKFYKNNINLVHKYLLKHESPVADVIINAFLSMYRAQLSYHIGAGGLSPIIHTIS